MARGTDVGGNAGGLVQGTEQTLDELAHMKYFVSDFDLEGPVP